MSRFSISNCCVCLFLALAVAGAVALVTSSHAGASPDAQAAAKQLVQADDAWSAAAGKRDVALVASFYATDALAYPPGAPVAQGKSAAQEVWAAYFADPSFNISWETGHAEVASSGELGFTSGAYEATYNGPDGKPVVEKGKYLCTWRKQKDGSWKATHDMWNTDAP